MITPTTPPPAINYLAVRNENLAHETNVRSVGILFWVGAALTPFSVVSAFRDARVSESAVMQRFAICLCFSVLLVLLGNGIKNLKRGVLIPVTVLLVLGLLSFPIGTLLNGYFLYVLHCKKGQYVFSKEYAEAILETQEIKYKIPVVFWILIVVVAAIILLATLRG